MPIESNGRCCENCGNRKCANSWIAYNWNECIESNFTKNWKPLPEVKRVGEQDA